MSVLTEIQKQRRLFARCPNCDGEFRLADARLFDATRRLPTYALECLAARREQLKEERADLANRQESAKTRPRIAAESINIGKVVEKIAPSLPGFPVRVGDCRALFEPIDYVVFQGLSTSGRVDAVLFVDVKSGKARLSETQAQVRTAIERGRVSLLIAARGKATEV
jgi:predicted Holliday junction resolvase-like endonuclease